ncbi:MAG: hypothetical protein II315_00770 [Rikenellaceae bacterium]|nr:hypothetical protein [Rikenellaceae bacterium]
MKRATKISLITTCCALLIALAGWHVQGKSNAQSATRQLSVSFLGDTLQFEISQTLLGRLSKPSAEQYISLKNKMLNSPHNDLIVQLRRFCTDCSLCDWGRYLLVRAVSEAAYSATMSNEKIALQIFLLGKMGFDARAALSGKQLVMLLPFDGTVYERGYIEIDGRRFYIFEYHSTPDGYIPISEQRDSTLRPLSIEIGVGINTPRIVNIALPRWSTYLGEKISVPISPARIELMRSYPTTEKAPFHRAEIARPLADTILTSLNKHINRLSELSAAQFLLGLVQHGFDFTSDSDLFGRHKQMTIEESLFYGRNNCKDRTLIYSWLIDNLLSLPTILIEYQIDPTIEPIGHIACGVAFSSPVKGTNILYRGQCFTLCDPSYVDASIGQAIPHYAQFPMKVVDL